MNSAVERAIKFICEKYSEPLSLADIADSAILSKFHFCRTFREVTGVTPGRFLSAIRIYQAKRMLVNTGMNVTDIAFAVGYNSLGSFSNYFAASVGVSPGRFRRISQNGQFPLRPQRELSLHAATVTGTISFRGSYVGARVYLGLFDTPIVQRQPASAVLADAPAAPGTATYRLGGIPQGTWFLRAVAVADNADPEPWTRRTLLIGGCGPLRVPAGATIAARVVLRPRRSTDLPILLALPELEPRLEDVVPVRPRSPLRCRHRGLQAEVAVGTGHGV
jgi:AraC family transcriptional regulator